MQMLMDPKICGFSLADANAAILLEEKGLDDEKFADALNELITDSEKRVALSENIVGFANLEANKLIFDEIIKLTNK